MSARMHHPMMDYTWKRCWCCPLVVYREERVNQGKEKRYAAKGDVLSKGGNRKCSQLERLPVGTSAQEGAKTELESYRPNSRETYDTKTHCFCKPPSKEGEITKHTSLEGGYGSIARIEHPIISARPRYYVYPRKLCVVSNSIDSR